MAGLDGQVREGRCVKGAVGKWEWGEWGTAKGVRPVVSGLRLVAALRSVLAHAMAGAAMQEGFGRGWRSMSRGFSTHCAYCGGVKTSQYTAHELLAQQMSGPSTNSTLVPHSRPALWSKGSVIAGAFAMLRQHSCWLCATHIPEPALLIGQLRNGGCRCHSWSPLCHDKLGCAVR